MNEATVLIVCVWGMAIANTITLTIQVLLWRERRRLHAIARRQ